MERKFVVILSCFAVAAAAAFILAVITAGPFKSGNDFAEHTKQHVVR